LTAGGGSKQEGEEANGLATYMAGTSPYTVFVLWDMMLGY